LSFAVDCKSGQQIPKRSITRSITGDVVTPDRQKGHANSEISAARDERRDWIAMDCC
jgi:hypothetical protein